MIESKRFEDLSELYARGEVFLEPREAIEFVNYVASVGWAVFGLEGGDWSDQVFTPDESLLNDFTHNPPGNWVEFVEKSRISALEVLVKLENTTRSLRFYVVFGARHDLPGST